MTPDPIAQLTLTAEENAKLTPLEVLADFADATQGWVYLDEASRHYAEQKERSALVLRHWRQGAPPHVDFAFAATPDGAREVRLVILDAPDTREPLSHEQHTLLLETFLEALRDYLDARSDPVRLRVERDRPDATSS
jgi:hypothetical protein